MERRDFIKKMLVVTGGFHLTNGLLLGEETKKTKTISFAISSDIHKDLMPDADERITKFLQTATDKKVDFIVDLGDFCFPLVVNNKFLKIWNKCPIKKYHVLGNHDMDRGTKEDYMKFIGSKNGRYYSYDNGDFHFIVLDPNNLFYDGKYYPYKNANFYRANNERAHIDPEQIEWLKKDLRTTSKQCIIFSHQSLEAPSACKNQKLVREIFENENKRSGFKKVVVAFSGHDHTDDAKEINGINYIQINSMSYQWVGMKHSCDKRYPAETYKKYPNLKATATYEDPLYAIITIKNGLLTIDGVDSEFMKPHPKDIGLTTGMLYGFPLVPDISDRKIRL